MADYNLVIIGAGPGGYTGAIRAAQLGLKTAVIEKDATLGGTCLNVGCIPSKALLDSSENFHNLQHKFAEHGIAAENASIDIARMMKRKDKIVGDLTKGVAYLFKKNKITHIQGMGRVAAAGKVIVTDADGNEKEVTADNIMLATGSVPAVPPGIELDGKQVVTSTEALEFDAVPEHLIVVGAGVIGLELGSVWLRLGAKVTVVEFTDKVCGAMDAQMSKELEKSLRKQGFNFLFESAVTAAKPDGKSVKVTVKSRKDDTESELTGDKVLVAVGRRPYSDGLGLDAAGIPTDKRGTVEINEHFETKVKGIYAVGDLVRGPMLAHKAEEEGVAVAEHIANGYGHVNYNTLPGVVYTWPEFASVGKTEEELRAAGTEYVVGKFPFAANGRAKAMGSTEGMVKVLADKESDLVLGVHIVGPWASDMIAEAVMAMEFGASSEDIARAFHAHPTLMEVMREAALGARGNTRQM